MIDLKHEIERELGLFDPPDLWDRIQADAADNGDASVLDLTTARHRRRPLLWLAVAAVAVLLALVGAWVLLDDHQTVHITPATVVHEPPTTELPTTTSEASRPTTLAKGVDVQIAGIESVACLPSPCSTSANFEFFGYSEFVGQTLNIDAVEQDGEVTGEFRVNNVVVTLQCADSTAQALILGGQVTDDPDGQGLLVDPYGKKVAVGDLVALLINDNDDSADQITLFASEPPYRDHPAGSCEELVESIPVLDRGDFNDVAAGDDIETEPYSRTLAKGEDVVIGGFGDSAGQTLNIDAVREQGEVTGEFRVDNVVVTLECADTATIAGEIRLAGRVTDDPDGQGLATPDGVHVAVGDRVALIIRERGPDFDQVSLYANDSAGSCTDLLESVPYNLDGGYFNDVENGNAIETGGVQFNP